MIDSGPETLAEVAAKELVEVVVSWTDKKNKNGVFRLISNID